MRRPSAFLLMRLLVGASAISVFGTGSPSANGGPVDRRTDAAKNDLLLLMGRIGRGEITIEQAKELYGENFMGLVAPSPAPDVSPAADSAVGDQGRF